MTRKKSTFLNSRLAKEKEERKERRRRAEEEKNNKKQLTKSLQRKKKRETSFREFNELDTEEKLYKKYKKGKIDKATYERLISEI